MKKIFFFILVTISSFSFSQQKKIDSLKRVLDKKLSKVDRIDALDALNSLLINMGTPDESIIYFKQMAHLSKETSNISLETKSYRYLSESFMRKNDMLNAILFANKSLHINDSLQIVNSYLIDINQLGRVYHHFRNFNKAIEVYNTGIKFYSEKHEGKAISTIYGNLGTAYNQINDNEKAIECYIKQAQVAGINNDINQKSSAFYNTAWIYMELEQFEKAEKYYNKALKDSLNISLKTYVYRNYHGLGITYSRWGKYEKALKNNKKALSFFKKTGNKVYEFDVLNNMSTVYLKINNKKEAIQKANEALDIAKRINHKLAINGANSTLVDIYLYYNNYDKANAILRVLANDTIDPNIVNRKMKINIYENLYIINKAKRKYKISLNFLERQKELSDSLIREQRDSKIAEIETKYQVEKKEKEITKQKQIIAQRELEKQKLITLLLVLVFITIGIIFFLTSYYNRYKKNKAKLNNMIDEIRAIQEKLERKNKESLSNNKGCDMIEFHEYLKEKYQINKFELIDVWQSIALGISRRGYVEKYNLSENTVKAWIKELYNKLKKFDDKKTDNTRYSDAKAVKEYYQSLLDYELSKDCK